ncbi:hypothetical protein [Solilutibacter silvestris]|uniref:Uncharacterized protein n=1 Tax=Solilutibacter silvestris TaxID=1645665 RepID=A0A2K1PXZ3_9GAMM|nr:hypothetical protein [Lysobacter silvestris]PNS07651.1 hypothetical protein Lysil_1827 [Lysobacter silvestris]
MGRLLHSPERDRAWGRYYKQHGMNCITSDYFTSHSNAVRVALYQLRRADMTSNSRYAVASS